MSQLDKNEIKEILVDCYNDTATYGRVLFPNRFHRPFTSLHRQVFNLIDNIPGPRKYVGAMRGFGKTSIVNLLVPSKRALFQEKRYIVPISASSTMATQKSESLKHEFKNNSLIRQLFGDVTTDVFSQEQYVVNIAGHECCIMPRGAQQQVRGMLWRDYRPDLIIVDDLEDPDTMDSEEVRQKKIDWFFDDVMQCIDPYEKPPKWEVIVIGTILSPTSLIPRL